MTGPFMQRIYHALLTNQHQQDKTVLVQLPAETEWGTHPQPIIERIASTHGLELQQIDGLRQGSVEGGVALMEGRQIGFLSRTGRPMSQDDYLTDWEERLQLQREELLTALWILMARLLPDELILFTNQPDTFLSEYRASVPLTLRGFESLRINYHTMADHDLVLGLNSFGALSLPAYGGDIVQASWDDMTLEDLLACLSLALKYAPIQLSTPALPKLTELQIEECRQGS